MKIHVYEKAFLWLGAVMLVVFLGALAYAAVGMGMNLPSRAGEIDPTAVRETAPFDNPGVYQTGPNSYDVVAYGQVWSWVPSEIRVPAGAEITFRLTSADVVHGFQIEGTRVNVMLLPGQITELTYTFREPGEHILICHEYCGINHHLMSGRVVVE
jgi:cytochrome c oxidase subunit 2